MDEGRFGCISTLTDCWAPAPIRPKVPRQVVRESLYAFAAVAPKRGELLQRISPTCNTPAMCIFILDILGFWPDEPILLVLDGAGWHKAKALPVPERMRLWHLPPYCPECNPSEHLWDDTREKGFANEFFATLDGVKVRLITQLEELAADPQRVRSLTNFPWLSD